MLLVKRMKSSRPLILPYTINTPARSEGWAIYFGRRVALSLWRPAFHSVMIAGVSITAIARYKRSGSIRDRDIPPQCMHGALIRNILKLDQTGFIKFQ